MIKGMKKFPISFWSTRGWDVDTPEKKVSDWSDLGITLAMVPAAEMNKQHLIKETLDLAHKRGMKCILCDMRARWQVLRETGEEAFRKDFQSALDEYGSHPALFGFYVGDEPDAPDAETAFRAMRINNEMAPHLTAYLNLLPWFDWIGERMGTPAYAPYLDRSVKEGASRLLSYDCYSQMLEGKTGYNDYFNNLREHSEAARRNNVPFMNVVLSSGHLSYRCPTKDELWWQLTTSVAMGASAISWFIIDLPGTIANYRNTPINELGDRTVEFGWMREVNCVFNNLCGEIMNTLTVEKCFCFGEMYGGITPFEPFDSIVSVSSDTPLIVSSFHNEEGEKFYVVCNNSTEKSTYASLKIKGGVKLSQCVYGNKFEPIGMLSDPVGERMNIPDASCGFLLAPGRMMLLKEEKNND